MPWHITIIEPAEYPHSQVFVDVAQSLLWALLARGETVSYQANHLKRGAINIMLGAHLLLPDAVSVRDLQGVIYNFEQLPTQLQIWDKYPDWLRRWPVWDYHAAHVPWLIREMGTTAWHVPVGYAPTLTRIPERVHEDIDVVFLGSVSDRRDTLLRRIHAAGLNVTVLNGVYGLARDAWLARARVALNCHQFNPDDPLEVLRLLVLWANRRAVVSECRDIATVPLAWREAAVWVPYDQLPDACVALRQDPERRRALAARGFAVAQSLGWDHLSNVLSQTRGYWARRMAMAGS
jgi:hypothetical protein